MNELLRTEAPPEAETQVRCLWAASSLGGDRARIILHEAQGTGCTCGQTSPKLEEFNGSVKDMISAFAGCTVIGCWRCFGRGNHWMVDAFFVKANHLYMKTTRPGIWVWTDRQWKKELNSRVDHPAEKVWDENVDLRNRLKLGLELEACGNPHWETWYQWMAGGEETVDEVRLRGREKLWGEAQQMCLSSVHKHDSVSAWLVSFCGIHMVTREAWDGEVNRMVAVVPEQLAWLDRTPVPAGFDKYHLQLAAGLYKEACLKREEGAWAARIGTTDSQLLKDAAETAQLILATSPRREQETSSGGEEQQSA